MGKGDYRKVNECWDGEGGSRSSLNNFYGEAAQDKPSTGKKKVKEKPKKSNHKHDYEKVLINYEDWNGLCVGRICRICGKVVCDRTAVCLPTDNGYYRAIDDDELLQLPEYKDLRIINGGKFI